MSDAPFHLRACSTADAPLLSLVACAAFLEAFAGFLDAQDILAHCEKNNSPAAFEKYLTQSGGQSWLAEAEPGDAPVGYFLCCEPEMPEGIAQPGDYELKRIYLLHRYHGTGVGPALMNKAIEVAQQMDRNRLLLGVNAQNARAIAFYKKMGFEIIGERYFTVGATTHFDYVMGRSL